MKDYNLQMADAEGDKIEEFASWVESNETEIIEAYMDRMTIDDVPEDFINDRYQSYKEDQ